MGSRPTHSLRTPRWRGGWTPQTFTSSSAPSLRRVPGPTRRCERDLLLELHRFRQHPERDQTQGRVDLGRESVVRKGGESGLAVWRSPP